ncbi:MAG: DAK2 domain-containing protein [Chloroflexi bacterium]|nr:MAG: DAK2 domain-containing protein [Chloroflexota bacterium]
MQEQSPRPVRTQRPRRISVFDGQDLKKALLAGAAWLEEHREAINALNVFPVPDGDTGSNMSATMQAAMQGIVDSNETSAGVVAAKVAHSALMGARGNSGVILSQTFRGFAQSLDKKQTLGASDLADALQEASQQEVVIAARLSVARTPDLLPTLKQAGVVDSGGQGFCTILEGIWRYIRGEVVGSPGARPVATSTTLASPTASTETPTKKGRVTIEEEFGYEVVFLLRGEKLDVDNIRQTIIDMGGVSTVVAGDEKMLKVHTHTPWPGKILDYGVSLGSLLDINIENLQEQSLIYAAESEAEHAADARDARDTQDDIVTHPLDTALPLTFQTMNPSTEELLAAVNAVAADQVIILPNNGNVILSARQAVDLTDKEIYVVPTDTLPQGIAAMTGFNFEADFATNCQVMTETANNVQTAEITTAVRAVQMSGVRVREGDFIGLINGNLAVAGQNMELVIRDTLHRMNIDRYEIVTLYYGEDVTAHEAQETAKRIKAQYSHIEIEVVDGGQPYYAYILSAE